jgi:hypothetical protein
MSVNKSPQKDESCGCKRRVWWYWGCWEYKTCDVYTEVGSGYDGFVKDYNQMRLALNSQVQSKCASAR